MPVRQFPIRHDPKPRFNMMHRTLEPELQAYALLLATTPDESELFRITS